MQGSFSGLGCFATRGDQRAADLVDEPAAASVAFALHMFIGNVVIDGLRRWCLAVAREPFVRIEPIAQYRDLRRERHYHAKQRVDTWIGTWHAAPTFVDTVAAQRCRDGPDGSVHRCGFRAETTYQDL